MVQPRCRHLIAAFVTVFVAIHLNAQQDDKGAIEATIRSYEHAVQDFDFDKANSLLAPNAVWIEEDSAPAPADQWPQWWREAKTAKLRITNQPHDFDIRVHGDVAHVVLFVDTETIVDNEAARAFTMRDHPGEREWQSTAVESEVLIKTPKGWRIALGHTSQVPQQKRGANSLGNGEDALSAKVDEAVRAQMREQKIPGVSLAVVRNGKVIKATGYGLANIELSVPVAPQMLFHTASLAKAFTAIAVMMLMEEGRISLDDKLSKYLPEAPAAWNEVTVRHLLTHTSGIRDYFGEDGDPKYDFHQDFTEDELVRKFAAQGMRFPPGEKWSYCNAGYIMLGAIIHRVTGRPWFDFVKERIFDRLGMTSTRSLVQTTSLQTVSADTLW